MLLLVLLAEEKGHGGVSAARAELQWQPGAYRARIRVAKTVGVVGGVVDAGGEVDRCLGGETDGARAHVVCKGVWGSGGVVMQQRKRKRRGDGQGACTAHSTAQG